MDQPPSFELIDVGVNLAHASFRRDRGAVIERALAAGVRAMVVTGTSVESARAAIELAQTRPGVLFSTAGVHPHDARRCDDRTLPALRDLLTCPEVVAVGECGLDFNRDFSPRPVQERWFERQLELAVQVQKPVFLHERDAHDRFVAILRPYLTQLSGAVVHCFTGSRAELETYLGLGCHIGITGWVCDERRGAHLLRLVSMIPPERLMLETDAPFLLPRDLRPRPRDGRNEPCYLPHVLRAVASAAAVEPAKLAAATTRTAQAFFGLSAARG